MSVPDGDLEVAERWERKRWSDFRKNLAKIAGSNPFQKTHCTSLVSWDQWDGFSDLVQNCPFTSKSDLALDRKANPPYGTNLTFPISEYKKYSQTSGTLGKPMSWLDTPEDWQWMLGNWNYVLEEVGIESGSRCSFAFSFGPFLGFWTAYEAVQQKDGVCIPTGGQSTEQRLQGILEHGAEYLFCTPTYAMRLTHAAKELGVDLTQHQLRSMIVAGETGGSSPSFREKISSAWGNDLKVHDHYGMTEVGPVAYEIPGNQGGLRIILESYFPEVIGLETGEAVKDGEQGELVLTTLGRVGCPVLRYRTGDLVKVKRGKDETGLPTFDLEGGILGRTDDMVVVRGVNLYPSSVDSVISSFPEILEYQVRFEEYDSMLEAKVRIESSAPIAEDLEQALQESFSLRIPVTSEKEGTLPRHEMKARRWIKPGS